MSCDEKKQAWHDQPFGGLSKVDSLGHRVLDGLQG